MKSKSYIGFIKKLIDGYYHYKIDLEIAHCGSCLSAFFIIHLFQASNVIINTPTTLLLHLIIYSNFSLESPTFAWLNFLQLIFSCRLASIFHATCV